MIDFKIDNAAKGFGATVATIGSVIPDAVISVIDKLLLAVIMAVISGLGFAAGTAIWNRLMKPRGSSKK